MIVAGEPSGDGHAAKLVTDLQNKDIEFYGMGGDKMQQSGVKLLENINKITVMGIFEVITKLPILYQTLFRLKHNLKKHPPVLLILVDFQFFNLKLAKFAKKLGIKTLFYIGPQIWAWRSYRIKKIKKIINNMAVIFPFEVEFYKKYNMKVNFVGHPLLDEIKNYHNKNEFYKKYHINNNKKIISFLPGSRNSEIINHLPIFLAVIKKLSINNDYEFLISRYKNNIAIKNLFAKVPKQVKIIENDFHAMLSATDFAVIASGTAVLESALLKTPTLVVVKVAKLSYLIYKKMINTNFISMVNIILNKQAVTELIQEQFTIENICLEITQTLSNQNKLARMQQDFSTLTQSLKVKPDKKLKNLILELIDE